MDIRVIFNANNRIKSDFADGPVFWRKFTSRADVLGVAWGGWPGLAKYTLVGYDTDDISFPAAICDHCHLLLNQKMAGNDDKPLLNVDSYYPGQSILLRNSKYECKICKTAASIINSTKPNKRGRPKKKKRKRWRKQPQLKFVEDVLQELGWLPV